MAFRFNICSKRQILPVHPPRIHISSYITGGLKKLYHHLKQDCLCIPIYKRGQFTDDNGHFCLTGSCVMGSRYRIINIISTKGQSSVLVKAEDMFKDDEVVVIKILHKTYYQLGLQETHCLQQLRSADPENISHTLRLLNILTFDGHYCMVFEYLHPDPVIHIFHKLPKEKLLPCLRKVAIRLLSILGFLQQQNVIHTDLKPDNILLKKKDDLGSLKVIDFGNAIHHIHKEVSLYYEDFEVQTPLYRAPEVMFGIPFGSEIDMWSFGCILAELYSGKPLFFGTDEKSIAEKMVDILGLFPTQIFQRGKFYHRLKSFTGNISKNTCVDILMKHLECRDFKFCSFLAGCLKYNPDDRMKPNEAALHPFLAPELPLGFLISSHKEVAYPAVFVSDYMYRPHVSSDIQRSQPSSLDLLKIGTSVLDVDNTSVLEVDNTSVVDVDKTSEVDVDNSGKYNHCSSGFPVAMVNPLMEVDNSDTSSNHSSGCLVAMVNPYQSNTEEKAAYIGQDRERRHSANRHTQNICKKQNSSSKDKRSGIKKEGSRFLEVKRQTRSSRDGELQNTATDQSSLKLNRFSKSGAISVVHKIEYFQQSSLPEKGDTEKKCPKLEGKNNNADRNFQHDISGLTFSSDRKKKSHPVINRNEHVYTGNEISSQKRPLEKNLVRNNPTVSPGDISSSYNMVHNPLKQENNTMGSPQLHSEFTNIFQNTESPAEKASLYKRRQRNDIISSLPDNKGTVHSLDISKTKERKIKNEFADLNRQFENRTHPQKRSPENLDRLYKKRKKYLKYNSQCGKTDIKDSQNSDCYESGPEQGTRQSSDGNVNRELPRFVYSGNETKLAGKDDSELDRNKEKSQKFSTFSKNIITNVTSVEDLIKGKISNQSDLIHNSRSNSLESIPMHVGKQENYSRSSNEHFFGKRLSDSSHPICKMNNNKSMEVGDIYIAKNKQRIDSGCLTEETSKTLVSESTKSDIARTDVGKSLLYKGAKARKRLLFSGALKPRKTASVSLTGRRRQHQKTSRAVHRCKSKKDLMTLQNDLQKPHVSNISQFIEDPYHFIVTPKKFITSVSSQRKSENTKECHMNKTKFEKDLEKEKRKQQTLCQDRIVSQNLSDEVKMSYFADQKQESDFYTKGTACKGDSGPKKGEIQPSVSDHNDMNKIKDHSNTRNRNLFIDNKAHSTAEKNITDQIYRRENKTKISKPNISNTLQLPSRSSQFKDAESKSSALRTELHHSSFSRSPHSSHHIESPDLKMNSVHSLKIKSPDISRNSNLLSFDLRSPYAERENTKRGHELVSQKILLSSNKKRRKSFIQYSERNSVDILQKKFSPTNTKTSEILPNYLEEIHVSPKIQQAMKKTQSSVTRRSALLHNDECVSLILSGDKNEWNDDTDKSQQSDEEVMLLSM